MKKSIIKYFALGIGGLLGLSFIFGASLSNQFASKEENFYTALAYEGTPLPTSGTLSSGTYYISSDFTVSSQLKITSGNVIVNLNGHTLNGGGRDKGIFHVTGGTLTVNGKDDETGNRGTLNNGGGYYPGSGYSYGGALYITAGGATLNDLNITNCQSNWGGAIHMSNSAVTLNNCNLSHNIDTNGYGYHGAITVGDCSSAGTGLTVNGGEMFSNDAAIRLADKAKATINGVYIHDNDNHGVSVGTNEGGLTISGNTIIKDNRPSSSRNLVLNNSSVAKVGIVSELGNDAYIGVTISGDTKGVFTNSTDTSLNDASKFFSDDSNYGVMKNDDGQLMLAEVVATITVGSDITNYDSFASALSNWVDGSTLTLLKDVTISENMPITFKRTLDLNGYGILQTGDTNIFDIEGSDTNRDLTIIDSSPTRPHAITLSNYRGTGVSDGTGTTNVTNGNGTAYITGGYLTGGNSSSEGGAIRVYNRYSKVNITGGTFIGNTGTYGGAISLYSNSVSLSNITVIYNKATQGSGGIHNNGSTVTISDSNIQYNIGNNYTGGIFSGFDTNHVSIQGNTIINNNYVGTSLNNLNVEDGYVKVSGELGEDAYIGITAASDNKVVTNSDNTSYNNASKFHADNANLTIYKNSDGQLKLTNAVASVTDGTTFNEYSNIVDAIAAWNSASSGATLTLLKDVTISTAIVVNDNGNKVIDLNGFTLSGTPGANQAIVYVNGGTVTINGNGGTLCKGSGYHNGSYTRGGAIAVYANGTNMGNVTINDCNITNNSASFGGAIFVSKGTTATLNNCNVYNNDSSRIYGILGAIYVEDVGATVNVNGGEIYNNDAGIYLWGSSTAGSKANLNGVYVHDNDNYGVRVDGNDNGNPALTITGDTIIKNNSTLASPEAPGNLRINNSNNAKVAITSPLGENASIGVTLTNNTGVFTSGWSTVMGDAKPSDYFFSDNSNYSIYLIDGEAYLGVAHTVTFNTNGRGIAPDPVIVVDGLLVNKPTDPTVEGYEVKGWYKEAECENIWDFDNDTVAEDITLYALWDYDESTANVIKLINDIGTLTYDGGSNDSLDDILAAITAYDALTPGRKDIVNGVNKDILDHDVTTYHNVDKVGDLINAIPEPSPDKSYYDAVDLAKTEYDKLTEEEVTILNSVINYQEFLNDNIAAKKVIIEIEEIGEVTYNGGKDDTLDEIKAAEEVYDGLTEDQKRIVNRVNVDELEEKRKTYDNVDDTVKKIEAIGDINYGGNNDSGKSIDDAREAYDSLTDEEKALVGGYKDTTKTLEDGEAVYDVLEKIDSVGEIGYDTVPEQAIEEARKAYDSLSEEQKQKVKTEYIVVLVESEEKYQEAKRAGDILLLVLMIILGLLLIAGLIFMFILLKKKKDDDDENNKKEPLKVASFTGLLPIIFLSHYLDAPYIILYVIAALTVIVWAADIIILVKKKSQKKAATAQEVRKAEETQPVSEDEEEVVNITDEKGNIFQIRFIKSFTAKLIQSPDETKRYYEELKNFVLSYKKTNSRVSWHYDSVNAGRNQVLKFAIRGKTLCVYLPLNADDYIDTKYKVEKSESKKYEEVPCLYRIKNDRRLGYAKELIKAVCESLGLVKGEEEHKSYYLHYEENKPLIIRGLIKELKVQVNKPVQQPVPEPVNEEEDEVVTVTDKKGNIFQIRFVKSFTAKLIQSPDETKKYYEELKNYVLSYKKTTSRISWHYDSINSGRNQVLKFSIRGKTLCVYYPLNADDYAESKYKVEKVESKKFIEVPCLYRIKNDRRRDYAKDLIDTVMANLGLTKGEEQHEVYSNLPYEPNKPLIERGLIKELKVQVNKPVEQPQVLEKKVNADGDEIVVTKDASGNIFEIRYIKSFTAKMSQSSDEVKDYYTELKNYALSYKKANSRVSWHYDSINVGRNQVLKFSIRGKTLCLYYALDAEQYAESKYKVEKVESKKFEDVPCLYRIKNDRRRDYAKDLIDVVMDNVGASKGEQPNEDYRLPFEETKVLLEKGLIKELKTKVNKPVEEHHEAISVSEADQRMSDEKAEASIEEEVTNKHRVGKKEIINIDTLSLNYKDGDVVNLDSLIKKKLVSPKTGSVKVLARGTLDKKLNVVLDDFSLQAVKMIVLLGGHVKKIR